MAYTTITKPSLRTVKWDSISSFWDEEDLSWDLSGYLDLDRPSDIVYTDISSPSTPTYTDISSPSTPTYTSITKPT